MKIWASLMFVAFCLWVMLYISKLSSNENNKFYGHSFVEQKDDLNSSHTVMYFYGNDNLSIYDERSGKIVSEITNCEYDYSNTDLTIKMAFISVSTQFCWINENCFKVMIYGEECVFAKKGSVDDKMKVVGE